MLEKELVPMPPGWPALPDSAEPGDTADLDPGSYRFRSWQMARWLDGLTARWLDGSMARWLHGF